VPFPHQRAFYDEFLAVDATPHQALLAPPGLGKRYVAQMLAHQSATGGRLGQVLVLAPGPLVTYFAAGIRALDPSLVVGILDRRRFREITASPPEDTPFPPDQIVVASIDFAKKEEVGRLLAQTRWSLIVVDEAHRLRGDRQVLVRQLADKADRLLLLSSFGLDAELIAAIPQLRTVRWSRDVVDPKGRRLLVDVPRSFRVVEYKRSDEEVRLSRQLIGLLDRQRALADTRQGTLLTEMMLRALSSSPIAIQEMLIHQRVALDPSVEENEWWGENAPASDTEPAFESLPLIWPDAAVAAAALDELISALDELGPDSKASALRELVHDLTSGEAETRFVVFTLFANTAAYVAEILADSGLNVQVLTGSMPADQRLWAVNEWTDSAGALILTDGASEGLALSSAHIAVHYDLPELATQMEQRWGRLDRIGQRETVQAYAFRDVRVTLESEEELLGAHGFVA
jgi:superfamily II DNA or RNA helicase